MMKYISTRGGGGEYTAAQAILQGIAPDKGLFVPVAIPSLPVAPDDLMGKPYAEIAKMVLSQFFDDFTEAEIDACVAGAYTGTFEAEEIVPLREAGDAWFLELYHGRTAAFKDMALSILPYLMTTAMKKEQVEQKICILAATSGDTGKAALAGFADVPGTEIVVFYPEDGVSQVQKQQMITQEGDNTHVFAIRGNFDDAQTGVKRIFADDAFAATLESSGVRLSSANSINIGRLVPQVAYYVYAYAKMRESGAIGAGQPMHVVVPTGNFGNILAAYYAKEMGVPIGRFLCASNENNVLTDFLQTGEYNIRREFFLTTSPSMDILISSNLERLLFHLSGQDAGQVKALMESLDQNKQYQIPAVMQERLQEFYGGWTSAKETASAIGDLYQNQGYLMDTHTAVAYRVYETFRAETQDQTPAVIASTASPYKFADSVLAAIGEPAQADGFQAVKALAAKTGVPIPVGLRDLDRKPVRHRAVIDRADMMTAVQRSVE